MRQTTQKDNVDQAESVCDVKSERQQVEREGSGQPDRPNPPPTATNN